MVSSFHFNFLGTKFNYVLTTFSGKLHREEEFALAEKWNNRNGKERNTRDYNILRLGTNEENFL